MDELLNEHINNCYESVKKAFVLREMIRSHAEDGMIALNTRYIPLHSGDILKILEELDQSFKIKIPDPEQLNIAIPLGAELHGFNERYDYIIEIELKTDIEKLYFDELEDLKQSTTHNGKLMEFNKQMSIIKKLLEEKKANLSKGTFDLNFNDVHHTVIKNINLYLVLLWIEKDLEYSLKIESGFIPVTKIGVEDNKESIVFSLSLGKSVFRGDNYTIDLNEGIIKFDNDEELYTFNPGSKIDKLLRILIIETKEKISHREAIERLGESNLPKNKTLESAKISTWLGDIRRHTLKTKYEASKDIILNKDGHLSLRR